MGEIIICEKEEASWWWCPERSRKTTARTAPTAMRIATAAAIHTPRREPLCAGTLVMPLADDGSAVACVAEGCAAFDPELGLGAEFAVAHEPEEAVGAREESVSRFKRFRSPRSSAAVW